MEKRFLLGFAVALIALAVFLDSSNVHAQAGDPFKYILGEQNMGSWKDEIMSSIREVPGPANDTSTLVLAANRTKRPDFLLGFHKYRGGWNIANKHYWTSVAFTGAGAFVLAFLLGLALFVYCFCRCKINLRGQNCSWPQRICCLLLIVFTLATLAGCITLSVGQVKFHGETFSTVDYLVNQSEYTMHTLKNVTGYLSLAKNISVAKNFLPSDIMDDIDRLNVDLENSADTLEEKTNETSTKIRIVFNTVEVILIVVAVLILIISILGLMLSIFRHLRTIQIFIVIGWVVVVITFFLFGGSIVLDNTISDTCMAMGEWVENPHAETALSNILPCVDQNTTNQTLFKSKQVINDIVNIVNEFVGSVANSNPLPSSASTYYNQSGSTIPPLCYPYDSQLQDRNCSALELSIDNAAIAWQNYTCSVSAEALCTSTGRLTPSMYTELVAAVNVGYALEHYAPPLLNLRNCNFVRDTFRKITCDYCPPLEYYIGIVNVGLVLISVGALLSVAIWVLYANRHPSGASIGTSESLEGKEATGDDSTT